MGILLCTYGTVVVVAQLDRFQQEVFELGHSGRATVATSVTRYDTGDSAVMNFGVGRYDGDGAQTLTLAVGDNDRCQLYKMQLTTDKDKDKADSANQAAAANGDVNQNGGILSSSLPNLVFDVTKLAGVQTDFK